MFHSKMSGHYYMLWLRLLSGVFIFMLAFGVAYIWNEFCIVPTKASFASKFSNLRIDMTRTEIIDILGQPAGDFTTSSEWHSGPMSVRYEQYDAWIDDDGIIAILFHANDRALDIQFFPIIFYRKF